MNYTQCELRKGDATQLAYIPSKFAVCGKILNIQGVSRSCGWQVINVYESSEVENVINVVMSVKRHKKATGDSLKKE